ncbi:MAG TPA: hypothetical protein VIX81_08365 [Gammaproteobacteria bacterium]
MNRELKRQRAILRAVAALARDEAGELAKLRRLRTLLYWTGAVLLGLGTGAALTAAPGWSVLLSGGLGGLALGLGAHYDSSLNQWPTLRPYFDGAAARRDAAELGEDG